MPSTDWTTSPECRTGDHCRTCQDPADGGRRFRLNLLRGGLTGLPPDGSVLPCPHGMNPPPLDAGPGTELKTLLGHFRWLGLVETESCNCKALAAWMNQLGPDGCAEQMDTIVDRLEANHAKLREGGGTRIPFTRLGALGLVWTAVQLARAAEARRQSQHAERAGG